MVWGVKAQRSQQFSALGGFCDCTKCKEEALWARVRKSETTLGKGLGVAAEKKQLQAEEPTEVSHNGPQATQ